MKKRRISISRVARDNRLLSLHIERDHDMVLKPVRVKFTNSNYTSQLVLESSVLYYNIQSYVLVLVFN